MGGACFEKKKRTFRVSSSLFALCCVVCFLFVSFFSLSFGRFVGIVFLVSLFWFHGCLEVLLELIES